MYILNKLDYAYTDYVLLTHALMDSHIREVAITSRPDIIRSIQTKDFDTDTAAFKESLDKACDAVHGEYLARRSLSSLRKIKTFKVKGIDAGFGLAPMKGASGYPEIVALHNASRFARLGMYLLPAAEEMGGMYLECFGEYLAPKLYAGYGFEIYRAIENVKMSNGRRENLYYMKLKWAPLPRV